MISLISTRITYRLLRHTDVVRFLSKASKSKGLSMDQLKTSIPKPKEGPVIQHSANEVKTPEEHLKAESVKEEVVTSNQEHIKQTTEEPSSKVTKSSTESNVNQTDPKTEENPELKSTMSKEETERLEARQQRSQNIKSKTSTTNDKGSGGKSTNTNAFIFLGCGVGIAALVYANNEIQTNKNGFLGKLYYGSPLDQFLKYINSQTFGRLREVYYPATDKLLPDFVAGPFYGPLPPGALTPPLLVIDLEKTILGSVYDGKHGWRHARRPGLEKFLEQMRGYYEVALFSENDKGMK